MSLRQSISSRKLLKSLNFVKESATLKWKEVAAVFGLHDDLFSNPRHIKIEKPVTAILIGAGHRGNIYADYALEHPEELKIVAIADTNPKSLAKFKKHHSIDNSQCYVHWKDVFGRNKFADAVVIATPDHVHTQPVWLPWTLATTFCWRNHSPHRGRM